MVSLKMTCEIAADGTLSVRIPQKITPGLHEVIVVIDEAAPLPEKNQLKRLLPFAGTWKTRGVDPVTYQRQIREEWR